MFCVLLVFFKQKTAYEMRISDWSSDVCSSDLGGQCDEATDRIFDPRLVEPLQRRIGVEQRLGRREGLRRDGDERVLGAEFGEHFVERGAVDVPIGRASCRERVCQYV